jgi:Zn finger protein HypA/HybF involved in hydrogenase expression
MWICGHCGVEVESADWDTCWNCLWSRTGEPPASTELESAHVQPLGCLRCRTQLQFIGTKSFYERGFVLAPDLFDLYACPRCGHVELVVSGGDRRPHDDTIG